MARINLAEIAQPATIRLALAAERRHYEEVKLNRVPMLRTMLRGNHEGEAEANKKEYLASSNRRIFQLVELLQVREACNA